MKSSIPSTRLKYWGLWAQDGNNGRVTNRAGYASDHLDMAIYVYLESVTPNASSYVVSEQPELVKQFKVTGAGEWQDFSAEISGVMPHARIAVGGVKTSSYQNRMMVDDIKVELLGYE